MLLINLGVTMKKKRYWFKIDNAGKVFPSISNPERTNTFRLSASLYEKIDPILLEKAINDVLPRFESFAIQIKNGIFWQYFQENHRPFKVKPEPAILTQYFNPKKHQGYLFQVYYFEKRITLETFHALTDGSGALQFLQSILYHYLTLKEVHIDTEGLILATLPNKPKENEDAFIANFDKSAKKPDKETHAFHFKGETFDHQFSLLFTFQLSLSELKKTVKTSFDATITQYFSAVIIYAIMKENAEFYVQKKPLKLFIPINLRPYFDAVTLRNFSLYLKNVFDPKDHVLSFDEILLKVKSQFSPQLTKASLLGRISQYVSLEKSLWIRLLPFFFKNIAFKIGYDILGAKINTASFSNLGLVKLPEDMISHVESMNFIIGGFNVGFSSLSYQDITFFNVSSRLKDTSMIKAIVEIFHLHNIHFQVISNYYDDYEKLL
jgi:hypothetical protein